MTRSFSDRRGGLTPPCAVPPLVSSPGARVEWLDPDALVTSIRTAWQQAGHEVEVWVEFQSMPAQSKAPRAVVRSTLISGLPRAVWHERYAAYLAAGGRPLPKPPADTVDA